MTGCSNVTIETGNSNCTEGKWYARLPFQECAPGYEHPTGFEGSGQCYCLADPEAKKKLDCLNDGTCTTGVLDILALLTKYWYVVVAVIVLILISGRR